MSDWYVKRVDTPYARTTLVTASSASSAAREAWEQYLDDTDVAGDVHVREVNVHNMKTRGPIYRYRVHAMSPMYTSVQPLGVIEARRMTPKWWEYSFIVENKDDGRIVRHVWSGVAAYSGRPAPAKAIRDFAAKLDPMHATSDRIYVAYEKGK
jgi:hypothetical protein